MRKIIVLDDEDIKKIKSGEDVFVFFEGFGNVYVMKDEHFRKQVESGILEPIEE